MIHKVEYDGEIGYVISADQVWRPGSFTDEASAKRGQRLTDEQLTALMKHGKSLTIEQDHSPMSYWRIYAGDETIGKGDTIEAAVHDALRDKTIQNARIYPYALTAAQLQAMTT